MSFWLVALKEKGMEGLLVGVLRCWLGERSVGLVGWGD